MAKRQTVWLSTMMILSLMVIGYYTVDDTLQPVPTAGQTEQTAKDLTKQEQPNTKQEQPKNEKQSDTGKPSVDEKQTSYASDWFIEQFMKQEKDYFARVEQLQKVIADGATSTDEKAKAEKEMRELNEFSEKSDKVADKIMEAGFEEALVTKDNSRINVTVQARELSKEQVAKIYMIVSKELSVPASQIVVSYRQ
jgi:stage III sporulation protein AH